MNEYCVIDMIIIVNGIVVSVTLILIFHMI